MDQDSIKNHYSQVEDKNFFLLWSLIRVLNQSDERDGNQKVLTLSHHQTNHHPTLLYFDDWPVFHCFPLCNLSSQPNHRVNSNIILLHQVASHVSHSFTFRYHPLHVIVYGFTFHYHCVDSGQWRPSQQPHFSLLLLSRHYFNVILYSITVLYNFLSKLY